MKRSIFSFIVLFLLIITGCKKVESGDPNYPTTITSISSEKIKQILIRLSGTPLYECSSVDSFGFCYVNLKNKDCGKFDTVYVHYSKEEIIDLFYQSILEYKDLLNVTDTIGIKISSILNLEGMEYSVFYKTYPDSIPQGWIVTSNLQKIGGFEIPKTEIKMVIQFDKVRSIGGMRYSQLYVPATDVYTEDLARSSLLNVEMTDGSYTLKPSTNTYWYPSQKIVFPIILSDKIELRICWSLFPGNWQVVVDTQTGEVLSSINVVSR